MTCKDSKKKLYLGSQEKELLSHLENCVGCRKESKSIQALDGFLKGSFSTLEPSKDFERIFWQKILERQKEPWFVRVFRDLESFIPFPTPAQGVAFVLTAFLIGGTGGVVSARSAPTSLEAKKTSVQYLSGFHEFKGIPSSSVAAAYLKTINNGSS